MTTLLSAPFVLTMDAENRVLRDAGVLIEDECIQAVGPIADLHARFPASRELSLPNQVIMPGLINAHAHSGLLRGTAEGLALWDWLERYIDPMHRVLRPDEAEIAARLCYAESLLAGTTTIVDMWRFMEGSARAANELGIRAVLVPYVGEHPDHDYFDRLDDNERLLGEWHGAASGRVQVWVGIEHLFYAEPAACRRARALANRHGVGLHTHSNETSWEVGEMNRRFGSRPIQALERHGLLDGRTLLAHGIWLDEVEMDVLSKHGTAIAHCPTSNMKLASGIAPVPALRARGIAVGLGSDGEKENNNLDLLEEMKIAGLLASLGAMDPTALDAWSVLRMATIEGARALGMDEKIGSLEVGKRADLIAVALDTPRMSPLLSGEYFNLHYNLVYAAQGGDVTMTMVDGHIRAWQGQLMAKDLKEIQDRACHAAWQLLRRRDALSTSP